METSHLLFWLVLTVVVGHVMTKSKDYYRKRTRQTGVLIGILAAAIAWWRGSFVSPDDSMMPMLIACVFLGVFVMAASWIVLTLLQWILGGPIDLIVSIFGSSFFPRINTSYGNLKENRSQKQLAKARERIMKLENLPDRMPENFDELATHVIEWSQRREAVVLKGEDVRKLLDNYDAVYARKLVEILGRQEEELNGKT